MESKHRGMDGCLLLHWLKVATWESLIQMAYLIRMSSLLAMGKQEIAQSSSKNLILAAMKYLNLMPWMTRHLLLMLKLLILMDLLMKLYKLHLRIFLNNTRGSNIIKEYLTKMEKEVGKKIKLRSPQTNSALQKLFKLSPEEFLINDFTCHLKRKMSMQGRLFLSARIIGFHGDLFGHKTNFYFLWEDIEDIQVVPPTLSSMGSPIVVITLHPGRGLDAKHGAKTQDAEGMLKFHFQPFVPFNVGHRTIMALWRARSLSPEQKAVSRRRI